MPRILIVEDEEKIARFLELELQHEGYETVKTGDGRTGLELALEQNFDLMLVDIMLPGLNGLEVLRRLRKTSDLPVIVLTARDAVMDKVSGLDLGADDYMTKPFAIEELLARIRLRLRKNVQQTETLQVLTCGQLTLCPASRTVQYGEEPIELTNREFMLLQTLLEHRNIVMSREMLLEHAWGYQFAGETNVVDVYIRYLRQKLDERFQIHLIQTVRSVGYVIKDPS